MFQMRNLLGWLRLGWLKIHKITSKCMRLHYIHHYCSFIQRAPSGPQGAVRRRARREVRFQKLLFIIIMITNFIIIIIISSSIIISAIRFIVVVIIFITRLLRRSSCFISLPLESRLLITVMCDRITCLHFRAFLPRPLFFTPATDSAIRPDLL